MKVGGHHGAEDECGQGPGELEAGFLVHPVLPFRADQGRLSATAGPMLRQRCVTWANPRTHPTSSGIELPDELRQGIDAKVALRPSTFWSPASGCSSGTCVSLLALIFPITPASMKSWLTYGEFSRKRAQVDARKAVHIGGGGERTTWLWARRMRRTATLDCFRNSWIQASWGSVSGWHRCGHAAVPSQDYQVERRGTQRRAGMGDQPAVVG